MTQYLLIPYRHGHDDGIELRHTLRGVDTYLHTDPYDELRPLVVGDRPSWYTGEHLPYEPDYDDKPRAVAQKMIAGARLLAERGVRQALHLDDDFFLLYPVESVVPVHAGPVRERIAASEKSNGKDHWYPSAMRNVQRFLDAKHPQAGLWLDASATSPSAPLQRASWEIHAPMPIVPERLATALAQALSEWDEPLNWRDLYGNLVGYPGRRAYRARDGRYSPGVLFRPGIPWVSSDDEGWAKNLGKRVASWLPNPSRWERT